jgi:sec-independent protein translocase protein TatC
VANIDVRDPVTGKMPIKGHLVEIRDRIFKCVIALIIAVVISFIFANPILNILLIPKGDIILQAIKPTENMAVYFKVVLSSAVIIAMPYLVYQLFAFVAPGLTSKEKKLVYQLLPFIVIMFLCGVSFAYFVALPPALSFLGSFMSNVAENTWQVSEYIDIVTRMLLYVGLIFETPIIIMVLARMGIVSPEWLAKRRRWWFVLAFVLSAIITPTMDPINQSIIAIPLIILLELSIILARMVYKKRGSTLPSGASQSPQPQK